MPKGVHLVLDEVTGAVNKIMLVDVDGDEVEITDSALKVFTGSGADFWVQMDENFNTMVKELEKIRLLLELMADTEV